MKRLIINSSSITPSLNNNQTEIIFQRHCDYDREEGALKPESVDYQKQVILSFISNLDEKFDLENLKNTYFLFTSSNAIFKEKLKRCL